MPETGSTNHSSEGKQCPERDGVGERWAYRWEERRRPMVHPLRTPGGHVLTRDAPDDHPWHHALWFTIKFVNGENFWEEFDEYGVLRHVEAPSERNEGDRTVVEGALDWIRPDRSTVAVRERRRLVDIPLGPDAYAIDWRSELVPALDTTFDRTPFEGWGGYGGLTLRGRGDWHDTRLLLDDGTDHDRVLGIPSRWCDLSGPLDEAGGDVGVLIADHPDNPRHPVPWYASTRAATYGDEGWSNFANAAFLWDAPLEVAAGAPLVLRHLVVVHDGAWDAGRCEQAWQGWVSEAPAADWSV